MSGFKALRDVSNHFDCDLQQVTNELFSAQIGHKFEDTIEKKLKDLAILTAKLKLLDAKPLSLTPQVLENVNESALSEYGEAAKWKVLEQVTAKYVSQSHAVTALITAADSSLDADMVERKEAILEGLSRVRRAECRLRHLNALSAEAEARALAARAPWERALAGLRDHQERRAGAPEPRGPMYDKLSTIVDKLELIRWMIGRLVCARAPYDWLADPHRRLAALPLTRQHNTVEMFIGD